MTSQATPRTAPWAVTWLTWPLLLAAGLGGAIAAIIQGWDYGLAYGTFLAGTIVVLVALEHRYPLEERWRMTWRSFRRDLKYWAGGIVTIAGVNFVFGLAAIELGAGHRGPLSDLPLAASVPIAILAVDFLQYWQHRLSHELGGSVGAFLWRVHAAHHLPDRVHVLMHAAGHPINGLIVRGFVMLVPLYLLGLTPEAVLLLNIVNNVQGLVSHCNLDLRAGPANYVLVGAELHRFHHSADPAEGKNYAATLSLLDIAFGTFVYRPGAAPARLGVAAPEAYPDSNQFWRVMALPFAGARRSAAEAAEAAD